MSFLVIDIETVRDDALWAPPPPAEWKDGKEPFAPATASKIVCIGAMFLDDSEQLIKAGCIGEASGAAKVLDEAKILSEFSDLCGKKKPNLVSWNGRRFDMPVIAARCLRFGVQLPWYYNDRDYRYRFTQDGHCDLMDQLADYGSGVNLSLDNAAKAIGLGGKSGMEGGGGGVRAMFEEGKVAEILTYCLRDVALTAFLLLRWRLLRGALDLPTYQARARALYTSLLADKRIAPVFEDLNTEILFLGKDGE